MKKVFYVLVALFIFTGCGMMDNTPTKKVEALLRKYQMNDSEVITDLDNVLFMDSNLTDSERKDYRDFMKKHYADLTYKIKDEKINGNTATVDAEITVRDYSSAMNDANEYRMDNADMFDENNSFASYRLNKLKEVSETISYTLTFHLTKVDGKWQLDPLTSDDESKINGLYGVNDIVVDTTDESTEDRNVETDDSKSTDSNDEHNIIDENNSDNTIDSQNDRKE